MVVTPEYPEHEKLALVKDKSQAIGEFLDWLSERGIRLAQQDQGRRYDEFWPIQRDKIGLIAEFFEIDLNVLEDEKRAMLEWTRKLNQGGK